MDSKSYSEKPVTDMSTIGIEFHNWLPGDQSTITLFSNARACRKPVVAMDFDAFLLQYYYIDK